MFKCPVCKKKLTRLQWNSKGNILTCNNFKCDSFHKPISWASWEEPGYIPFIPYESKPKRSKQW